MSVDFDPANIPTETYRARIEELRAKRKQLREQLAHTDAELNWWEQGLELFAAESEISNGHGPPGDEIVVRSDLPAVDGKPFLRQAIQRVLAEDTRTGSAEIPVILARLRERDWLPEGKNAEHTVRGKLAEMVRKDELRRIGRGRYALLRRD